MKTLSFLIVPVLVLGLVSGMGQSLTWTPVDSRSELFHHAGLRPRCSMESRAAAPADDLRIRMAPAARAPNPLAKYRLGGSKLIQRAMEAKHRAAEPSSPSDSPSTSTSPLARSSSVSRVESKAIAIHRTSSGTMLPDYQRAPVRVHPLQRFERYSPGRFTFAKTPRYPLGKSRLSRVGGAGDAVTVRMGVPTPIVRRDSRFLDAANYLPQHALSNHLIRSRLVVVKDGKIAFRTDSRRGPASLNDL